MRQSRVHGRERSCSEGSHRVRIGRLDRIRFGPQRIFNGREYLIEYALPLDYAFVRAFRADTAGNLQFRRSQRNFNPVMAMAAKMTIAEVEEAILPAGAIDPDEVHSAGIFVQRLVKIPAAPDGLWPVKREPRAGARS